MAWPSPGRATCVPPRRVPQRGGKCSGPVIGDPLIELSRYWSDTAHAHWRTHPRHVHASGPYQWPPKPRSVHRCDRQLIPPPDIRPKMHANNGQGQWPTPAATFVARAGEFGPFDLDPAATPDNARVPAGDDGLSQLSKGRIFLNSARWPGHAAVDGEGPRCCGNGALVVPGARPAGHQLVAGYDRRGVAGAVFPSRLRFGDGADSVSATGENPARWLSGPRYAPGPARRIWRGTGSWARN